MWEIFAGLSVAALGYVMAMRTENVKQAKQILRQECVEEVMKQADERLDSFERALKRMSRQIDNIQDQRKDDIDRLTKIMTALSGSPIAISLYTDEEEEEQEDIQEAFKEEEEL